MSHFEQAVKTILRHEGGLADNPADPGGLTNYGVSMRFIRSNGIDLDKDGDIDREDILHLTPETAKEVYKEWFWDKSERSGSPGYDSFTDLTVATKLFDIGVNAGHYRSGIIAQKAANALGCNLLVDGKIGPKSIAAINGLDPAQFVRQVCEEQKSFYEALVIQKPRLVEFLAGWLYRASWPWKKKDLGW